MAALDKSVFSWAGGDSHYGFGEGLRIKCIGDNEKAFSRWARISARAKMEKLSGF